MPIYSCDGKTPRIHESAFIAPNATIIGDVEIGPDASVFYGAVLRGDIGPIRVGARTNIQDNAVLHVERDAPCVLEDDVTVGHLAMVHGAHVEAGALIGMSSIVLSHARVGQGALVAGGALVREHQEVPPRTLVAGVPAKVRRELADAEEFVTHAGRYVTVARMHRTTIQEV